jgi:hypothetical protein
MKEEITLFFIGALSGIFSFALFLTFLNINPKQMEQKMQKEAISHGAARYDVDTNGVVSFKWNK